MAVDARKPTEVLRARLKVIRRRREWSQEDLAERLKELGVPLDRAVLARIEGGSRGVSLDEALVLAAALNVPPAVLLFPLESGEKVAITSRNVIHPHLAARWLAGEAPLATTDRHPVGVAEWRDAALPLRLHDRLIEAQDRVHGAESEVRAAEFVRDEERARLARQGVVEALGDLAAVRREMRDAGIARPELPDEWRKQMLELAIEEGA